MTMPMQHMRELELKRKQIRQQKEQQHYFQQQEQTMMKNITTINCRYITNCKYKDNKNACIPCRRNEHHAATIVPVDNYKERIQGLTFL